MRMTKKSYTVPETAFEQFLKPLGILMGSDPTNPEGKGSGDTPGDSSTPHAPGRKPF